MSSFPNVAVNCVLWSVLVGRGINKHAVVSAGLSVGLWAASCGKLLAPSQLGLGQVLSPGAFSLALSPLFMRQMAPTSECWKYLVVSTVIPQCIFP